MIESVIMIIIIGIFILLGFGALACACIFFRMGICDILEARELRLHGLWMNIFVAIIITLSSICMGSLGALIIGIAIDWIGVVL